MKQSSIIAIVSLLLLPVNCMADEKPAWAEVVTNVSTLASAALQDFDSVTVTKQASLLVVEANVSVRNEPVYDAAGRRRGTRRIVKPKPDGFILRIELKSNANNIRRTSEDDRENYTLFETKVVLSKEKNEESTDVRASAIFIRYECGKTLDDSWRKRLQALIGRIQALDIKEK
jgi:hypothetical protein